MEGVLRQNNWRMILGGTWGDGRKYTNRMKYWDAFAPRARYTYEAITTSPSMTIPQPGKAQLYIGKFENEEDQRLQGGNNYVIRVEKTCLQTCSGRLSSTIRTPAPLSITGRAQRAARPLWAARQKVSERTDGSNYVPLGPDALPKGWEANQVQTLPGRGWFPYMRMYGAEEAAFNDAYKFPTVNKVTDFSEYVK
jgi:hypothetical protein